MTVVGVTAVGCGLVGVAGWGLWTLQQHLQRTTAQLASTQETLAQTQRSLTQLEGSHQELTASYDSVKGQWETTTAQLKDVNSRHTHATQELKSLSETHRALGAEFEATRRQAQALEREMHQLTSEQASLQTETTSLKERVASLQQQPTISPDELRQLNQFIAQREAHAQTIEEWLLALSLAHDRLLEERLASLPPTHPATQDTKRLAAIYRELAESYFALGHYPKAARTFERALTVEDDARVHARLALLYGRFLHDAARAKRHADLSGRHIIAESSSAPAEAYGLPRRNAPLVWDWLVN